MGWVHIPWFTITDSFDEDFGVDEWHGHNAFIRDGDQHLPHLFRQQSRRRADGRHLELPRYHALGRQEHWEDSPEGYPQTPTYKWWNWHDSYVADAAPDKKWVEVSDAGEAAFRARDDA